MAASFTDWEGTCLAHHGIKGQKWGVRNYQNSDGTLTAAGRAHYGYGEGGSKKLGRQYNRQLRKLNRLEKKSNIDLQRQLAGKYKKRAAKAVGVAGALGAAAVGSHHLTALKNAKDSADWFNTAKYHGAQSSDWLKKMSDGVRQPGGVDDATWGHWEHQFDKSQSLAAAAREKSSALAKQSTFSTARVNTRTKILAGAAAVAGGYAAYSAIRSKVAKSRTSSEGHQKAVAKYKKQYDKMAKQFKDTPYSELLKKKRNS